jgi:AraC family transcriptional regulator
MNSLFLLDQELGEVAEMPAKSSLSSSHSSQEASEARTHVGFLTEVAEILHDVRSTVGQESRAAHAAALRLVALLATKTDGLPKEVRGGLAPWQKRRLDQYLAEHLEEPLRVECLAKQVSLSVSYFCRAFKKTYGTSPHLHIIKLRVALAKQLMLTTTEPLSQIALSCGMADQAHLSRLFRGGVGESPSAWRRQRATDTTSRARSHRTVAGRAFHR